MKAKIIKIIISFIVIMFLSFLAVLYGTGKELANMSRCGTGGNI